MFLYNISVIPWPFFSRLFEKFPSLYQDIELYWKVMLLLSTYSYKLECRRFIQSKFEDLSFEKVRELLKID